MDKSLEQMFELVERDARLDLFAAALAISESARSDLVIWRCLQVVNYLLWSSTEPCASASWRR